MTTDREALVKLDTTPDATGLGRVIVDGKYYGLPVAVVRKFATLSAQGGEQTADTVSVPSYQLSIRDGLLRAAEICDECEKFYRELAAKDESIEIRQSAVDVANGYRGAAYAIRDAAAKEGK